MIHYVLTDSTLTFYDAAGKSTQVLKDHPRFAEIVKAIKDNDIDAAVELARPVEKLVQQIQQASKGNLDPSNFRRTAGKIQVTEWGVTLDGNALHGVVIDRLMEVLRLGLDVQPWVNFVQKLYQNPSSVSRNELYLWMEKAEMPITADGDFIAYKKVRHDYRDVHSGRFDNSVGKVVEMSRLDVDDDRNRTCSAGLHFCSKGYLPSFGGSRVMTLKINPADVVSIPSDYNNTKGRTWRYEVVGEVTPDEAQARQWDVYTDEYDDDDYDLDDDYFDDDSDDDDSDDDEASRQLIGEVFAAYAAKWPNVNSKEGQERDIRLLRANYALREAGHNDRIDSFNDLTVGEAKAIIAAWS